MFSFLYKKNKLGKNVIPVPDSPGTLMLDLEQKKKPSHSKLKYKNPGNEKRIKKDNNIKKQNKIRDVNSIEQDIINGMYLHTRQPLKTPNLILVFGGIGAGNTTSATQKGGLFTQLGVASHSVVNCDVDSIIQCLPEFKNSSNLEQKYMEHRGKAKLCQNAAVSHTLEAKQHLILEWTNENNLRDFCLRQPIYLDNAFPYDKAKEHSIVFYFVKCKDVESILAATNTREKTDGRHIPETVIRTFNENRAKEFVNSMVNFERCWPEKKCSTKVYSLIRNTATSEGEFRLNRLDQIYNCNSEEQAEECLSKGILIERLPSIVV